jgi:hypothetical protein
MKSNAIATFAIQVEKLEGSDYRVLLTVVGLNKKEDADDAAVWLHEAVMRQIMAIQAAEKAAENTRTH